MSFHPSHKTDLRCVVEINNRLTGKFVLMLHESICSFVLSWPFSLSQEPRHLQFVADFSDSDVYTLLSAKKLHGAPTDYGLCVKVPSLSITAKTVQRQHNSSIDSQHAELLLSPCVSSPQSVVQRGTWSCFVQMMSRPGPAGSQPCAC